MREHAGMASEDYDLISFRTCRSLDGTPQPIDIGRRNGRRIAVFPRNCTNPPGWFSEREAQDPLPIEGAFDDLTDVEMQTWQSILNGASISEIAEDEGISRQAIYERIRGSAKSGGGMISRNAWVWLWWTLRQQERI
jgi:hypothetical protein